MSTLKVDTILKRTGTGTITVGQSGDTISIPSGATLNSAGTNTLSGIASEYFSTTAFMDNLASATTVSNNTLTQLFTSSTERFDLGSNYSSGTYTIPTTGYYVFYFFACLNSEANSNLRDSQILIRCSKDSGTDYQAIGNFNSNNSRRITMSCSTGCDNFTAGDTLTAHGYINSGDGSTSLFDGSQDPLTWWYGYRVP